MSSALVTISKNNKVEGVFKNRDKALSNMYKKYYETKIPYKCIEYAPDGKVVNAYQTIALSNIENHPSWELLKNVAAEFEITGDSVTLYKLVYLNSNVTVKTILHNNRCHTVVTNLPKKYNINQIIQAFKIQTQFLDIWKCNDECIILDGSQVGKFSDFLIKNEIVDRYSDILL